MMGVVGGHGILATFDGDASLRKRPMRRALDPLLLMGAQIVKEAEGGRCRSCCAARSIRRRSSTARRSPRRRSNRAVLLAGLNARGRTIVVESEASRDHTEKMLIHSAPKLWSKRRARAGGFR